jgi:alanine racemase
VTSRTERAGFAATSLTVDLGAIRRNARLVARRAGGSPLCVVKANGYGHGAVRVASALAAEGVAGGFAVARPDEGFELRSSGVELPVLVLGSGVAGLPPASARELMAEMHRHRLAPGITSVEELELWLAAKEGQAIHGGPLPVHLKVDTGLGRAGLAAERFAGAARTILAASHLRLAGVYTHLAESERLDGEFTAIQLDRFEQVCSALPGGAAAVTRHAANSAAALHVPRARYDQVRVGGALYGVDLAAPDGRGELEPALRVTALVVRLERVRPGDSVGYGRRFVAREEREVGLLQVGYGDGLPSCAAGQAVVLLRGRRAPVLGAISMDLACVDVTGLGVRLGDEAVVLGDQDGERIEVAELARWSASTPYECLCRLSGRLIPSYRDSAASAVTGAARDR